MVQLPSYRSSHCVRVFKLSLVRLNLVLLALSIVLTALLDARLTFPTQPSAWVLRPFHLLAFGLWIGGAVWSIFIAVPAAQETLTLPVMVSASEHLQRFRRVILPTLEVTGLMQAIPYTGLNLSSVFWSSSTASLKSVLNFNVDTYRRF